MTEVSGRDLPPIDACAIGGVEIAHLVIVAIPRQFGVATGNGRVIQTDKVVRQSANGDLSLRQVEGAPLHSITENNQFGHGFFINSFKYKVFTRKNKEIGHPHRGAM